MTRTSLRRLVLAGAAMVAGFAAGFAVWKISPSRFSAPSAMAPAHEGSAGFVFMPLDKPRPLPTLHFTSAGARELSLADFRGRLVLLNLWASWCTPCRREMPTLDRLEAELGGPDFGVVALSIDRQGLSAVEPFFKELGLKALRIYLDPSGKAPFELNAPGIPTTLLIDQEGRELGRVVGPAEWDGPEVEAVIRKYLNHKASGTPRNGRARLKSALNVNADTREAPKWIHVN